MSYILEALRKSETERKQGEIPNLGSSVQIIHKPRKSGSSLLLWVVIIALLANAAVLGWLFWPAEIVRDKLPDFSPGPAIEDTPELTAPVVPQPLRAPAEALDPAKVAPAEEAAPRPEFPGEPVIPGEAQAAEETLPIRQLAEAETVTDPFPSASVEFQPGDARDEPEENQAVIDVSLSHPTLGNMPAGFQRRVPDLTFNSHIFSSTPESRRIMINDQYLKEGTRFQGMVVEEITEDGVVLSLQGESFVVSVVRNWNSPR